VSQESAKSGVSALVSRVGETLPDHVSETSMGSDRIPAEMKGKGRAHSVHFQSEPVPNSENKEEVPIHRVKRKPVPNYHDLSETCAKIENDKILKRRSELEGEWAKLMKEEAGLTERIKREVEETELQWAVQDSALLARTRYKEREGPVAGPSRSRDPEGVPKSVGARGFHSETTGNRIASAIAPLKFGEIPIREDFVKEEVTTDRGPAKEQRAGNYP